MKNDIFEKYAEWIAKSSAHEIIDNRALILHGDSAEILRDTTIAADRVITDPPYDFDSSGGKMFGREKSYFDRVKEDKITDGFNLDILRSCALADSFIIFIHNDQLLNILQAMTGGEEPLYPSFVDLRWIKDNPPPFANKNYQPDSEIYIHAWRPPFYPQGGLENLGRWIKGGRKSHVYDHPTIKPQYVMKKCVINGSKKGDVILDPFCGSGSTGVAALREGRFFIGIEQKKKHYETALQRLKTASGHSIPDLQNQRSLFSQPKETTHVSKS